MREVWKIVTCWGVLLLALPMAVSLTRLLELHTLELSGSTSAPEQLLLTLVASLLLAAGLYPLARSLAGSLGQRAAAWIAFLLLALGLNTLLEGSVFTIFFRGVIPAAAVMYASDALLLGLCLGFFFGRDEEPPGLGHRAWESWMLRGTAAWLAFPAVCLLFSLWVAPLVLPYYRAGILGLHLPRRGTLLEVQLIRSALLLAASLPLVALWKGSRRALWLSLGLAYAVTLGLYGAIGTSLLPAMLRIAQCIAVMADSFAYAAVLVLLFGRPAAAASEVKQREPEQVPEVHA